MTSGRVAGLAGGRAKHCRERRDLEEDLSQFLDAPLLAQEGASAGIHRVLGANGRLRPGQEEDLGRQATGSCGSPRAHPSPASSGPSG